MVPVAAISETSLIQPGCSKVSAAGTFCEVLWKDSTVCIEFCVRDSTYADRHLIVIGQNGLCRLWKPTEWYLDTSRVSTQQVWDESHHRSSVVLSLLAIFCGGRIILKFDSIRRRQRVFKRGASMRTKEPFSAHPTHDLALLVRDGECLCVCVCFAARDRTH